MLGGDDDDRRRRRRRGIATGIWVCLGAIMLLALLAAIFSGIAMVWIEEFKAHTPKISSVEESNAWFPCETRISYDYDGHWWTSTVQKPDGASCNDVCLNASLPATCEHGQCVGTCAGESETWFEFGAADCPEIGLADIVDAAGLFRVSLSFFGKCFYLIFDLEKIEPNGFGGLVQVFLNSGEAERRLSKNVLGLIGDKDAGKVGGCYDTSYFPLHLSPIESAVAMITFDCARYIYEGIDNYNLTLALSQPIANGAALGLPSDFIPNQSVIEYVWTHKQTIQNKQIGVKGSFPKIQWKP